MRTKDPLKHPLDHSSLSNVSIDQHHARPSVIEVEDTTTSVEPLPGGPFRLDVAVPYSTQAVMFSLQGGTSIAEGGAKPGVVGVANRSTTGASASSVGGPTSTTVTAYCAAYSRAGGASNLSHKIFTTSGWYISLTNASLVATGPSTRVLRLEFTNYGGSYYTLWVKGEIQVLS